MNSYSSNKGMVRPGMRPEPSRQKQWQEPCRQMQRQEPCRQIQQHKEPYCQTQRQEQSSCPKMEHRETEECRPAKEMSRQMPECFRELDRMSQEQLLLFISQVSFVVSDMLLYLDTHPTDRRALAYCNDHIAMRNHALKKYAHLYGPLTIDTANDAASDSWEWVNTPWPWEGRTK